MQFINSTAIVPRTRKVITKMANPIADSAAATVRTNKANTWPIISSKETENTKKFKLTANNINSIDINIIRMLRLLRRIPQIPKIKMIIENVKYLIRSISETWNVRAIQIMWGRLAPSPVWPFFMASMPPTKSRRKTCSSFLIPCLPNNVSRTIDHFKKGQFQPVSNLSSQKTRAEPEKREVPSWFASLIPCMYMKFSTTFKGVQRNQSICILVVPSEWDFPCPVVNTHVALVHL